MSDYLSNLTARSFNQAEVLQPRLASRFEPLSIANHPPASISLEQPSIATSVPQDLRLETRSTDTKLQSENTSVDALERSGFENKGNFSKPNFEPNIETNLTTSQSLLISLRSNDSIKIDNHQNLKPEVLQSNTNLESSSHPQSQLSLHQNQILPQVQRQIEQNASQIVPVQKINQASVNLPSPIPLAEPDAVNPAANTGLDSSQTVVDQQLTPSTQSLQPIPTLVPIATESHSNPQRAILFNSTEPTSDIIHASVHNIVQNTIHHNSNYNQISNRETLGREQTVTPRLTPHIVQPSIAVQPQNQPASQNLSLSEPVSESTPTIQVTIGRIEVRAAVATPSSPKPRPSSPVMGLDDYLRQRAKGAS
ncbi:MAG TPA: hypothetical protein V6D10_01260 [Trichocoleus sp.]|jgi:hypothetical protein